MPERGRVIAGTARGVRLEGPRSTATRPLSDRVKESLFASLEAEGALEGPFLDLYAGTGAGGIEALSRGAPAATFVERDPTTCVLIESNLAHARLDQATVIRADALAFLRAGRAAGQAVYRASLVDPPYEQPVQPALELLDEARPPWLGDDAVVVAKHFWRDDPPPQVGGLRRIRQRRFGETVLSFYTRDDGSA